MENTITADPTLRAFKNILDNVKNSGLIDYHIREQGANTQRLGNVQLLSTGDETFNFWVGGEFDDFSVELTLVDEHISRQCSCEAPDWCNHQVAALYHIVYWLDRNSPKQHSAGKAYTREGMVKRVLQERRDKAEKAEYKMQFGDNVHGEHVLLNEKGVKYRLTFRHLEEESGYCSCPDFATNKLGTCKHLMFAYKALHKKYKRIPKQAFPFVEVFLDPLHDYRISWYGQLENEPEIEALIQDYFGDRTHLEESESPLFLGFLRDAALQKKILIRPEVTHKIQEAFDGQMLQLLKGSHKPDWGVVNLELYPYQKEGVEFATFRKGAIIADEMGLGKTLQAIAIAIMKKQLFGFKRTLVICPASLKAQWKAEIEKFTDMTAEIVVGNPQERRKIYQESEAFFLIVNYEIVLRDKSAINSDPADFVILDEAQRIKNYKTITAAAIKGVKRNHSLVLTGTPIENRLIDLFSLVGFVAPGYLTPLWEFSYQHCFFDPELKNKITGYYNLQGLKERMESLLIRRRKVDVVKQLPSVRQIEIPVGLHPLQHELHASYSRAIQMILAKKFITPFDLQRIMLLMTSMRMVCDSTYLVDPESNESPKLQTLKYLLTEELDLQNSTRKIIIFSEWIKMNRIIGQLLRELGIGFVELNGKVPVKNRGKLIETFNNDPDCKVFLSSEAGGSGLNLQAADTVINFELPWNPAKKNQRIGRIHRIGQTAESLTVFNLITPGTIETKIASGLMLKQELFDGVLDPTSQTDLVDFSKEGRAQFLQSLQQALEEMDGESVAFDDGHDEDLRESDSNMFSPDDETFLPDAEPDETESPSPVSSRDNAPSTPDEKRIASPATSGNGSGQASPEQVQKARELESVMNQGLGFLAGIMKMATGQEVATEGQSLEVNAETGEVTMKFKLPGF
jgi:superfamily II DNA or RNA helicase/predicted nucleic acid-binding Zn finger protein